MILWVVVWLLIGAVTVRTVNYGRWVGKEGNTLGAVGLYLLSLATILISVTVYVLNNMR
jgi:hypothetical protein